MERREAQAFEDWRKEKNKLMPDITRRVFSLRGVAYMGHGFHYALENRLGRILALLNDFDADWWHSPESIGRRIGLEVGFELLVEQVEAAEKSIIKH